MLITANKSPVLIHWFRRYTRRYLQRSFQTVRLQGEFPRLPAPETPLLVCMNHSSWWDLLLAFYLATELFDRDSYGVMDARQLERYRFFARLGMIGVDRSNSRGAREFLAYAQQLLAQCNSALWLTPQGEMISNYIRPIQFQSGLGHLAAAVPEVQVLTIAIHYEFWNERLPEAFISISTPVAVHADRPDFNRRGFVHQEERRLEIQLDSLLRAVEERNPVAFRPLLQTRAGISPTYDAIRAASARLRGEPFTPEHGHVPALRRRRKSGS